VLHDASVNHFSLESLFHHATSILGQVGGGVVDHLRKRIDKSREAKAKNNDEKKLKNNEKDQKSAKHNEKDSKKSKKNEKTKAKLKKKDEKPKKGEKLVLNNGEKFFIVLI
jgi:hypothetical protein